MKNEPLNITEEPLVIIEWRKYPGDQWGQDYLIPQSCRPVLFALDNVQEGFWGTFNHSNHGQSIGPGYYTNSLRRFCVHCHTFP